MKVQIDKAEQILRMLVNRAKSFPSYPMGGHIPEAFAYFGESSDFEPTSQAVEPAAWPCEMIEGDFSTNQVILQMKCSKYKLSAGLHFLSKSHPAPAKPLSDEQYTEIAHCTASRYTHRTDPKFVAYTFLPHTLKDFVRKIEAALGIKETS